MYAIASFDTSNLFDRDVAADNVRLDEVVDFVFSDALRTAHHTSVGSAFIPKPMPAFNPSDPRSHRSDSHA